MKTIIRKLGISLGMVQREPPPLSESDVSLQCKEAAGKVDAARQIAEDSKVLAERAREAAEMASQQKSEFLASMSQAIRTPLNDIIGMAQLLADSRLSRREQNNCRETILQSSIGLRKIINDVLDIAKMESGEMEVRSETFDLWEMCKHLQQRFQPEADSKGLRLVCRCQDTVPPYLIGDELLVEQVLANLLDNALRYTDEGSVVLQIECRSIQPSGVELHFQVGDTGIGVPREMRETIFEKSIGAPGIKQRHAGGSGLGLAICRQQVELMGGDIGLRSAVGQGSIFEFSLSLSQETDPASIKTFENIRTKTVLRKGARVLLVEDNKVNQKVGVAILERIGCRVDAVDNGKYAIQQIRKEQYDIVLMDCEMPILDGFETTEQIRSMPSPGNRIPIVAITANAMKDDQQRCIEAGMDDFISKPVCRETLVKLINKHTAHLQP